MTYRHILLSLFFLCCALPAPLLLFAQNEEEDDKDRRLYWDAYEQGRVYLNGGAGWPSIIEYATFENLESEFPPVSFSAEYAVTDMYSVGGYFGYTQASDRAFDYSFYVIGAKGSQHFVYHENWDVYFSAMLGVYVATAAERSGSVGAIEEQDGPWPYYAGTFGARYFPSDNIGLWAEVGWNVAFLNGGITFKF